MKILDTFKHGFAQAMRTKRMILFAWFINVLFAIVIALPFLNQLDGYLRDTVMDESLLTHFDSGWLQSYRADMEKSELTRVLDPTILGYAPFVSDLDMLRNGTFIRTLGNFLYDFFVRWELNTGSTSLIFFLSLLYLLASSFLAGGFIGMYARDYRSTFPEFLHEGARYFGKFFRLALLALLVYYLFFTLLVDWVNNGIAQATQNDASETVPYLYYLIRTIAVLFTVSLLLMIFDYARIRMVVDERTSALGAVFAGARFALVNFPRTYGLYLALTLVGVVIIVIYAVLQKSIPQQSYWPLVFLFVVQQATMLARFWLKGAYYAGQTALYRGIAKEDHLRSVSAAPSTT